MVKNDFVQQSMVQIPELPLVDVHCPFCITKNNLIPNRGIIVLPSTYNDITETWQFSCRSSVITKLKFCRKSWIQVSRTISVFLYWHSSLKAMCFLHLNYTSQYKPITYCSTMDWPEIYELYSANKNTPVIVLIMTSIHPNKTYFG